MTPAVPLYAMPCVCGIVWWTTRTENLPGERCRGLSPHDQRGCGRPLPAPRREEVMPTENGR